MPVRDRQWTRSPARGWPGGSDNRSVNLPLFPRPLSASERSVIDRLLSVPLPGVDVLRQQIEHAQAVRAWVDGLPSVDLDVPAFVSRAEIPDGPLPVSARVHGESGDEIGELLLWVKDGALAALEYAWYTTEPPSALPVAESIAVEGQPA